MERVSEFDDGENLQTAISQWSQGDAVLGEFPFFWAYDPQKPLKDSAEQAEDAEPINGVAIAGAMVKGVVLISQTCDIVRAFSDRPYIQLVPLVEVDRHTLDLVRKGMRPRFLFLPAFADQNLVADLDRIISVEKTFLGVWERRPSFSTEAERRSFAESIRRYYSRPAFPAPFVEALRPLEEWFRLKHDKTPDLPKKGKTAPFHPGPCLRALEMVLVKANPSWESMTFRVEFVLVRKLEEDGIPAADWETFIQECRTRAQLPEEIPSEWSEKPLAHLPAKLYLESDILDLGHLSDETRRRPKA